MQDNIISNLQGIRRQMLKILGEVSSLTNSPMAIEEAIDDYWHANAMCFRQIRSG